MLSQSIIEKYRFIKANSGYIVGQSAIGALKTAVSAEAAEEAGFTVQWDYDDCFSIGEQGDYISDEAFQRGLDSGRYEVLVALANDLEGDIVASLGGIIVDWRDHKSAEDYKRSVELELLAEAWDNRPEPEPEHMLVFHDFGNLHCQVLKTSEDRQDLIEIADRINFLMGKAGHGEQFRAIVTRS